MEQLQQALKQFAGISDEDWQLSAPHWRSLHIKKGNFFNHHNHVCKHVAFIVKGFFRLYYVDTKTDKEHNLFFLGHQHFMVSLKSFLTGIPCPYNIQATEDAELFVIDNETLQQLYNSHGWERFGRLLAEQYFIYNQARAEDLLTRTAEERYLLLLEQYPDILNRVSLGHISSYLGLEGPSLSRIRKRLANRR
ncbi:Crp/Fnr family transcriptional regulator [Chitinophaga pendula]|uniref:Crp/Fnr family transcriptional regulator n=1 Tax=Chitinophaga TaxID=79328 RepID=UPI000BAF8EB9|nr:MULTISPECIES: Crp/Fnr family transcriptional regulator [Chitinophaga]ASZ14717.1 Crp/Fnr family transcriptional regulator [Chitinophaga sp. MD30]UCJ07624.1 Crp/Fnr family transcriptional regulator [Chitinophaga pendula]